jgi:hypothetical protein
MIDSFSTILVVPFLLPIARLVHKVLAGASLALRHRL